MQDGWPSFRITALLYVIIAILPLSFYFFGSSVARIQADTKAVRQAVWVGGAIEHLALVSPPQKELMAAKVDKAVTELSVWAAQHSDSKFYIGDQSLDNDFAQIKECWGRYTQARSSDTAQSEVLSCWEQADKLSTVIEKMVYLQQKELISNFYLALFAAIASVLLVIYFVRSFISVQLKKHAIYDTATKLFNQNYFLSALKNNSAKSIRHKHPLNMTSLLAEESGDTKQESNSGSDALLSTLGGLIASVVRESDIPCYYGENLFMILLTDTDENGAHIFEKRLRQKLETHDFMTAKPLRFKFATIQHDGMEKTEAFVARAKNLLI
jgi:diguanylate cyclase (GGDEF)-like protein